MGLKNLANICRAEQDRFIRSFDHVLTDMDGVIWEAYKPIPGALECINYLKLLGKKVNFVTNNGTVSVATLSERLKLIGLDVETCDIANPNLSAISYLKKLNFQGDIFAVGTQPFRDELLAADFKLTSNPPQEISDSPLILLENIKDDQNVKAVVYNHDFNLTILKLQKILTYLKREDCLFITAATDKEVHIGKPGPMIGCGHFLDLLTSMSGRQPVIVAKPSIPYVEVINGRFEITDPKRVLFMGDSILEDMGTAFKGGYQKLLVLSGSAKMGDIECWKRPVEYQPDYFIESLAVFNDILKSLQKYC
ncbi:hypothetical protein JTB14_005252 [Gonioctena quinquepunctata]|nr:hypothetical protein JTB14_005252 [Gonioctena quinquepunctata]